MDYVSLIKEPISHELADFIGLFNSSLTHDDGMLGCALEHVKQRAGKRMRPILILLMAKNFGAVSQVTLHSAVGLELLHTASLIHDDVVDEAKERRGQASTNALFDNRVAVLVGDYVLSTALLHIAYSGRERIVTNLAKLGQTLSNGEILQLSNIQNREVSEDVYYEIIKNKTAALFSACAGIGALSVGATEDEVTAAEEFGHNLGVIFQIRDDIFDYYDDANIGKPTGNDMAEGKLTLPVIYALHKAYTNNSPMFTAREYACDPIFGSTLYSAGSGKITFSASFYTSAEDRKNGKAKTTKDFPCDVTVDADGNGVYSYEYIDQTTFQTVTKTASIPRYNPDTPAGERLPDTCSSVMWVAGTSQLKDGASFLGNASDEFPLFQVNVVIQQGTKPGVYDIKFLDRQSAASGETPCQLTSSRSKEFPTELVGTSIAVGVDSLVVTDTEQDDVKFYTDDNTKAIRATDFATKITADVTYADSTTETGVDITGLVDCYGATPKTLYDKQAQDGFFISENMPLYCNGSLLKWKDTGNNVTQNIMVGKRGDINHDSKVDSQDLFYLMYYIALKGVGSDDAKLYDGKSSNQYMESFLMYLMDFDTWGMTSDAALNSTDMYYLMLYIANKAVGNNVTWNAYVQ